MLVDFVLRIIHRSFASYKVSRSSRPEVLCIKNVSLKIPKNPQENTCAGVFLSMVAGLTTSDH